MTFLTYRLRSILAALTAVAIILAALSGAPAAHAQSDKLAAHKAAALKLYTAFSAGGNPADFDALFAKDFSMTDPNSGAKLDAAAMKAQGLGLLEAIPDAKYTVLIALAEGDTVGLRYHMSGTFKNDLKNPSGQALKATGKPIAIDSNALIAFNAEDKIVGYDESFDNLNFLTQLGAIPASGAPAQEPPKLDPAIWTIKPKSAEFTAGVRKALSTANLAAYGEGKVDALDAVYTKDFITYPSMGNLDAVKAQLKAVRAAVPDMTATYTSSVVEGNWVAYRWAAQGTMTGELDMMGMKAKPTNKPVAWGGIALAVVNDEGKVTMDWNEVDNLTIAMQFGLMQMQ